MNAIARCLQHVILPVLLMTLISLFSLKVKRTLIIIALALKRYTEATALKLFYILLFWETKESMKDASAVFAVFSSGTFSIAGAGSPFICITA